MIVPKIMFFEPSNHIWCAGGKFDRLRGYTSFHLGGDELDKGQCDYSMDVEYCPTCCMLIASEVFEKIGVMDDAYFVYWDDSDFCYRAMKHNMRLYYDHSLRLYHKVHSLTGGNSSNFSQRYYTRNKVYFLLKNLGWLGLFHLIPFWIYLLLDPRIMKKGWALRQRAFMEGLKLSFSKIWVTEHH
jgi:GT2 family glycosyltransferase